MKAWVVEGKAVLKLREIPKPSPGPEDVLVRISHVGLCGSDIEIYKGNRVPEAPMDPLVLGHEAAGVVEACGGEVAGFKKGDRVVLRGVWGCCAEYVTAPVVSPPNPRSARFLQVLKAPDDVPLKGLSLLEVIPKIIMAVDRAEITPATDVMVIGQGVTGLLVTQIANLKRPHRLVAVDLFEDKLRPSRAFGATHTLVRSAADYSEKLAQILPDGADVIFPCHLDGAGVPEAIELLKWRGRIVLWGCLGRTEMDFFQVHVHGADILAAQMDNLAEDARYCRIAMDYIQKGIVRIGELTTHTFAFDRMAEAFRLKEEPRGDVVHVLVEVAEE